MHPILFKIGPFELYTYGAFLAVAFLTAIYLGMRETQRVGLKPELAADLGIVVIIASIVGARIFYILFYDLHYTLEHPSELLKLRQTGLVYYGGLLFAVAAGLLYARRKGAPLLLLMDIAAPSIAIGQAIGRIGCFMSGCCYGEATWVPWAVKFPHLEHLRHPTQLYESFAVFAIFLTLMWFRKRKGGDGQVALLYVLLYAPARFIIEFFRGDNPEVLLGMTISQVISLLALMAAVAAVLLFSRHLAGKKQQAKQPTKPAAEER
ncbi:MAG: prolipoprotein diacylglyceryl transferase [Candidatus Abyssobacteria bacterium SURF_5]|uniref:Phosphatidylglycerol--prolipoprotein diacylglyceryl transferase n=1 Tax=Abyssobacteria bacterium (strain SURF_5) TaxID=2093360 RepID=A0A3A4NR05_ABYX5|nr:MAG: prolipoprotein diacylglyceryl transferase [Candidatus Abyssubacteria bacterium SURF_5]